MILFVGRCPTDGPAASGIVFREAEDVPVTVRPPVVDRSGQVPGPDFQIQPWIETLPTGGECPSVCPLPFQDRPFGNLHQSHFAMAAAHIGLEAAFFPDHRGNQQRGQTMPASGISDQKVIGITAFDGTCIAAVTVPGQGSHPKDNDQEKKQENRKAG